MYNKPVKIDLSKLTLKVNPFKRKTWVKLRKPITKKEVQKALDTNNLVPPNTPIKKYLIWDLSSRKQHIGRVAWFVKNFSDDFPIEIDFGIPSLGANFELTDGNHRLAAAIFLKKEYVLANVSGVFQEIKLCLFKDNKKEIA